jgi:hypothetical protein
MLDLVSIGEPQFLQQSATGSNPGTNGITVDLPQGPTDATDLWVVDGASLHYSSPNDPQFGVETVGIFVVPLGLKPIKDVVGTLDVANRGVQIAGTRDVASYVIAAPARYLAYRTTRDHTVVPYGYTLRGIVAYEPALAAPTGTLVLQAIIRRVRCQ